MLFKNKPTQFPRMLVLQDQLLYYARFQTWESGTEKCGHPILIPNNLSTVTPGLLNGLCERYLPVARSRKYRIKSSGMTILAVLQTTPLSCLSPRKGPPIDTEGKKEQ